MKKTSAADQVPEVDDEMKKKLAEQKAKHELEKLRRKTVHDAICLLTEVVTESELKSQLNILDINSWIEILEERFIARICGWALCNNFLNLPVRKQKYKLDKKNQKVYESYADHEKFCSKNCQKNFEHVKNQLYELPLWLTGEREKKDFELYSHDGDFAMGLKNENSDPNELSEVKNHDDSVEFVPDKLLVQLHSLHIAENGPESGSEEDEDEENLVQKRKEDDRQFLASVKSFVSSTVKAQKSPDNTEGKNEKSKVSLSEATVEEKLQRLRSKWGKDTTSKKKTITLVEAHHLNPEMKEKSKFKPKSFEYVLSRIRDWMTPETIIYVEREGQVTNEQVMKKFLSAMLDPQVLEKKETKTVKLPLIDNIDDHYRRVNIVVNSMSNYWQRLLSNVQIDFVIQHSKDLISTFNLNRENCIVNPDEGELLTILIFHFLHAMKPGFRYYSGLAVICLIQVLIVGAVFWLLGIPFIPEETQIFDYLPSPITIIQMILFCFGILAAVIISVLILTYLNPDIPNKLKTN